jgi:hypothetical protein
VCSFNSRQDPVLGCCENGNKYLGSIKKQEILYQLVTIRFTIRPLLFGADCSVNVMWYLER